jgi:transcription-repair coupling factor
MKQIWKDIPVYRQIINALKNKSKQLTVTSLPGASGASLAAEINETLQQPALIVVKNQETALQWYRDARYFSSDSGNELLTDKQALFKPGVRIEAAGKVILFPDLPEKAHHKTAGFDAHAHASLYGIKAERNPIAIVPALFLTISAGRYRSFQSTKITLSISSETGIRNTTEKLTAMGYERVYRVETPGELAVRGGILDVFVPMYSFPVRIEFFGNEIISIREFDPLTQKSISRVNSVELTQITEFRSDNSSDAIFQCISEWFQSEPFVFWVEPDSVIDLLKTHDRKKFAHLTRDMLPGSPSVLADVVVESGANEKAFTLPVKDVPAFDGDFSKLVRTFQRWTNEQYKINIVYTRESVRKHVSERLTFEDFEHTYDRNNLSVLEHPRSEDSAIFPVYMSGDLSRGFMITFPRTVYLAEKDIVGLKRKQQWRKSPDFDDALSFSDLQPGDLVVHIDHGIGSYAGLHRLVVNGKESDFLLLKYASQQKLYVPVEKLYSIQRYISASEKKPALDKMGGLSWQSRKKKVHESVLKLAAELLELFSRREIAEGYSYQKDDYWQQEFDLGFEYEETPDQLAAIYDVKKDMESIRPMDRIVCGDVGFGKTEVAMRAAFKAAVAGKQVAVLAPTTILVQQHFQSFHRRFEKFPVNVAMLSRFLKPADKKKVLEELKKGRIDVVVGTHSLLAKAIEFRDLGLLIIDEEHRFGVRQKEKIKQLRTAVDVLTLTATPIPRTLNMAFLGLRDISLIRTPPEARLPIKSIVTRFNLRKIRSAILEELNRGGQVYFVHNRIQSIGLIRDMLQKLVPEARIAVGHGQMTDSVLEKVMLGFLDKEYDVLLCTTIIESGLDIPSVNTIIINRADRLGIAQLYQLRGRVGRDRLQAYAWLLVPPQQSLTKKSRLRLEAIQQAVELGAGYGLAARDLDIRGAGDILGPNQHGHISAVGFEMYCRLIREAVQALKGEPLDHLKECDIRIPCETAIPESYIEKPSARLDIYRRLSTARSEDQINSVLEGLKDEYGDPPQAVNLLASLASLRIAATRLDLSKIEYKSDKMFLVFRESTRVKPDVIMDLIVEKPREYRFEPPDTLVLLFHVQTEIELIGKSLYVLQKLVDKL